MHVPADHSKGSVERKDSGNYFVGSSGVIGSLELLGLQAHVSSGDRATHLMRWS